MLIGLGVLAYIQKYFQVILNNTILTVLSSNV